MVEMIIVLLVLALANSVYASEDIAPDKTVTYKTVTTEKLGNVELKLHIFTPKNHKLTDKRPAIVFFFGGGWNGGNPNQFYPHSQYLASRGMVAISAEYRVKTQHGTSPQACVQDGKSAIRWVRAHAEELGIDPNMLASGGGSAGGHVAAATATVKNFNEEGEDQNISCQPDALVLFNPVFDNGPEGYGYDRVKEYWQGFSPMHNIDENTPPTIVFLGTKDKLIPTTTAEKYKKIMNDKGGRCDLHLYEGQAHGFFNFKNYEYYTKTV
ncbi:MAG: alpha/beta hydrolase, partial [Candidatus Latescibacteria bacterium]|nr:alpha/beta hydrolase [Candidatus Latescibacterota bacterium]